MVKFTKILVVSVIVISMALSIVFAQTDTATIDTSVASSTQVDISPNSFTWSNLAVGTIDPNYASAEIENIGSTNVSLISMDVTVTAVDAANPRATGLAQNYQAGNFLMASQDNITFAYITYPLYNDTPPIYLQTNGAAIFSRVSFGNREYFWMATSGNGSGPVTCDNGTLYYFNTTGEAHNKTSIGNTSLSNKNGIVLSSTGQSNSPQNTAQYGIASVSFEVPSGITSTYCMAVSRNCTYGRIWKWNNNINPYDNISACNNDAYFFNDSTSGGGFKPGQLLRSYFTLSIPSGIPNGTVGTSTLTVRATD
ncbi:MAG: hypothetical protein HY831_04630 [Candidatus Aenigmarchaeota archaeon]|nr:hypothetical protein [Candidatus Aenigmarchaeota archaeon]